MLYHQAIELAKENRELKDHLAWLMHGADTLNKATRFAPATTV